VSALQELSSWYEGDALGLNWEQCPPLWDVDDPDHDLLIEQFTLACMIAKRVFPDAIITHYVPPKGMNAEKHAALTPEEREAWSAQSVHEYQPIYRAAGAIGSDLYAHVLWHAPDAEAKSKAWMVWNLDTWLEAAKLAGGKPVYVWLMDRVEWNADQDANTLIPFDELVARIKFILEHEWCGDRIDGIVVWDAADPDRMLNAIRVACGLEMRAQEAGSASSVQ
jgi:hypothetical protein